MNRPVKFIRSAAIMVALIPALMFIIAPVTFILIIYTAFIWIPGVVAGYFDENKTPPCFYCFVIIEKLFDKWRM